MVACGKLLAVHGGYDAVARQRLERADLGGLHIVLFAVLHDSAGQRVLALLLEGQSEEHELFFADSLGGDYVGNLGLAGSYGTGLV